MALAALFFGCGAIFFAHVARSNNQALILDRIVVLTPWGATIFWWVLAAISIGFVLGAAVAMIHGITRTQRIVLTPRAIIVPRSRWSTAEIAIPYVCIMEVTETRAKNYRFLKIVHSDGKVEINGSMLATSADFDDLRSVLAQRIELLSSDALERRESLVTVLSKSPCPGCGEPFGVPAAEHAVSAAEDNVSTARRFVTECLEQTVLQGARVQVKPFYPITCDKCQACWWYGLSPRSFKPRLEPEF